MEERTQTALMFGIPLAIAGIGAAIYFATRGAAAPPPPPPGCNDGDQIVEQCWDGSLIVTHTCQNGQWQPTGITCTIPPTPECTSGATQQYQCPWGQVIITNQCISGQWVPTDIECPSSDCLPGEVQNLYCWDGKVLPDYTCEGGSWVKEAHVCPIEPGMRHYIKFSHVETPVPSSPWFQRLVIDYMWCRPGEYGECTYGQMANKRWDKDLWRMYSQRALDNGDITQQQYNTIFAELESLGY